MSGARHHVVFAVGADRPGIVAALTGALLGVGANLLDVSMTILSGHFAVALAVEAGPPTPDIEAVLAGVAAAFDLTLTVRAVDEVAAPEPVERHVVSVYGADRRGIVARVTGVLADRGVNIVDLETRRVGDPEDPVYAMVMEVVLPVDLDAATLAHDLGEIAGELEVDARVHPLDADVL